MINSPSSISSTQDIWFALPLTEIDFSQCRKCTPSYRILPAGHTSPFFPLSLFPHSPYLDYPRRMCSGRKRHEESSVLNDEVNIHFLIVSHVSLSVSGSASLSALRSPSLSNKCERIKSAHLFTHSFELSFFFMQFEEAIFRSEDERFEVDMVRAPPSLSLSL
jgi:hypothetical protein